MARTTTDFIILHCSATRPSQNISVTEIDRWHRSRGWRMVGYHYVIRRDGTLQEGRPLMDGGAHAASYNNRSVGVCLVGGVAADGTTPENNFTPAQWDTLKKLVTTLHTRFPQAKVIGHNDVSSKACPCFDAKAWWRTVVS